MYVNRGTVKLADGYLTNLHSTRAQTKVCVVMW